MSSLYSILLLNYNYICSLHAIQSEHSNHYEIEVNKRLCIRIMNITEILSDKVREVTI